jgi:hypothetical protein
MLVREHDQVREVRPGEEERRGVRHEHRAVEERPLAEEPPPRRVEEDGRHEDHRGVEVQHDRDGRVEQQQPAEQNDRPARRAGNPRARRLEDAVGRGRGADEQQARDECERRPRLREGGVRVCRRRCRRRDRRGRPERRESQPKNDCATSYHSGGTVFSSAVASSRDTETMSSPRSAAICPNSPAWARAAALRP